MLRKILTAVVAIGAAATMTTSPVMADSSNSEAVKAQKNSSGTHEPYSSMLWYNGQKFGEREAGGGKTHPFVSGIGETETPTGRSVLGDGVIKKKGYIYLEFVDRYTESQDKGNTGGAVNKRTTVKLIYKLAPGQNKPHNFDTFISRHWNWTVSIQVMTNNNHHFSLVSPSTGSNAGSITVQNRETPKVDQTKYDDVHYNTFPSYFRISPSKGYIFRGEERNCRAINDNGVANMHNYKQISFRPYNNDLDDGISDKASTLATPYHIKGYTSLSDTKQRGTTAYGRNRSHIYAMSRANSCWLGITNQGWSYEDWHNTDYMKGGWGAWSGTFQNGDVIDNGAGGIHNTGGGYGGCGYMLRGIYHVTSAETILDTNRKAITSHDYPTNWSKKSHYNKMTESDGSATKITLPTLRNVKGYRFAGWQKDGGGHVISGGTHVSVEDDGTISGDSRSSPVRYVAKWIPYKLTVNYHLNGGEKIIRGWHNETRWYLDGDDNKYSKTTSVYGPIGATPLSPNVQTKTYKYGRTARTMAYSTGNSWSGTYAEKYCYSPKALWGTGTGGSDGKGDRGLTVAENWRFAKSEELAAALGFGNAFNSGDVTIDVNAQWEPEWIDVVYRSIAGTISPDDGNGGATCTTKAQRTTYHNMGYTKEGNRFTLARDGYVFRNRWLSCEDAKYYGNYGLYEDGYRNNLNTSMQYYVNDNRFNCTLNPLEFSASWNKKPEVKETDESTWNAGSGGNLKSGIKPFIYTVPMANKAPNSGHMKKYCGKIVIQEGDDVNLLQFVKGLDKEDGNVSANDYIYNTDYKGDISGNVIHSALRTNTGTGKGEFTVTFGTHDNDRDTHQGVDAYQKDYLTLTFYINKKPNLEPTQDTDYGNRLFIKEDEEEKNHVAISVLKERIIATDPEEDTKEVKEGYDKGSIKLLSITYPDGHVDNNPSYYDKGQTGVSKALFEITDTMKRSTTLEIPLISQYKQQEHNLNTNIRFISSEFLDQIDDEISKFSSESDPDVTDYTKKLKTALETGRKNYQNGTTVSSSDIDLGKYYTLADLRARGALTDEEVNRARTGGSSHDTKNQTEKGRNKKYTDNSKIFYKDFVEIAGVADAAKNKSLYANKKSAAN